MSNFKHFTNKECGYYPCHRGIKNMNCMFCFCPLYCLGSKCGGMFTYTDSGIKDCSKCIIPHTDRGYEYVISKFNMVSEIAKKEN